MILVAYSFSTCIAVLQFTEPLVTLMMTGTPAALCVLPQVVPAPAVGGADEHPVARQAQTQKLPTTPSPRRTASARRTPSRCTVSP